MNNSARDRLKNIITDLETVETNLDQLWSLLDDAGDDDDGEDEESNEAGDVVYRATFQTHAILQALTEIYDEACSGETDAAA